MMTGDLLTFRDPGEQDISDIPSGWGAGFGAAFEEGFQSSWGPLAWRFTRRQFMDPADTENPAQMALRTTLQGVAPAFTAAARATVESDTPMLSEAEANEAFAVGDFKFKGPVSLERAMDLYETNRARLEREDIMRRSSAGTVARFIGGLGGAALDPVNIAAGLLPGALLSRTGMAVGSSFTATTTAQRLGYGALEGAIGSAALAPGTLGMSALEGRPYGVADALLDIAFGTILTAGLHTTIGAFVDWRNTGKDMPVVSQAMENATIETRMQVERGALSNLQDGRPVNVAPVVADEVERYITAYHGSPHQFDAFSLSKMGTGEGAQAYGWGLYFAESEKVARAYQKELTQMRVGAGHRALGAADGDVDAAIAKATAEIDRLNAIPNAGGDVARRDSMVSIQRTKIEELTRLKETGAMSEGSMYQVRIRADKDAMLDWDKPLREQPEAVQDAFLSVRAKGNAEEMAALKASDDWMGRSIGSQMTDLQHPSLYGSGQAASQALAEAGIPGIKYLDAGSRGAGDGSRNFVIFDDKLIGIESRNGQPVNLDAQRAAVARDNLQPYADPTDIATSREADEALQSAPSKARSEEQGIGAVTPETRELDAIAAEVDAQIAAMKQSGALSAADEASLAAADDLVKKAELETKARDYAAICLSGVDITPKAQG